MSPGVTSQLLSVQGLSHDYYLHGRTRRVLTDVSFDLDLGGWAVVLGSNGAGKSTLLNAVSGSLPIGTGRIHLSGRLLPDVPRSERAKSVALVRQDPLVGTAAGLTVAEHLALAASRGSFMWPLSRRQRLHFESTLEGSALAGRLDQPTGSLSGGERQLLTVILARLRGAKLLLIDEGFSALDLENARRCLEFVKTLVDARQCGVLLVTHDFRFASKSSHRLLVLRRGRLVFDSSLSQGPRPNAEQLWQIATLDEGI